VLGWPRHVRVESVKIGASFNVGALAWYGVRLDFGRQRKIGGWIVAADQVAIAVVTLFTISMCSAALIILGLVVACIRPFDALCTCRAATITFQFAS
jgi:hypothetical protein